jgi:hypothetical protein
LVEVVEEVVIEVQAVEQEVIEHLFQAVHK